MSDLTLTDVKRLAVNPGDVLLVRVPADTPRDMYERIVNAFKEALPSIPVFVVVDTVEFSVVSETAV